MKSSFFGAVVAALAIEGLAQMTFAPDATPVPGPNTSTTTPIATTLVPTTTVPAGKTTKPVPSTSQPVVPVTDTPSSSSLAPTSVPNGTVVTPVVPVPSPGGNSTNGTSGSTTPTPSASAGSVQCPFIFSSALLSTQVDASPSAPSGGTNSSAGNGTSNTVITLSPPSSVPTPSSSGTSSPISTTSTPPPTFTTKTTPATTSLRPTTPVPTTTDVDLRRRLSDGTGGFSCDAAFYGKWITSGLKCGGQDLDVAKAVAAAACATYKGEVPLSGVTVDACLSTCLFPSCTNDQWDYSAGKPGLGSAIYAGVDFSQWLTSSMKAQLSAKTQGAVTLQKFTMTVANSCSAFGACSCPTVQSANTPNKNGVNPSANNPSANLISNWVPSTRLEQAGVATASVSQTTVYASLAVSGAAAVATSAGAVGSSAATAASAGGGSTTNMINMAQFIVCTSQLNIEHMPQIIQSMGAKLSFSTFSFFVWEGAKPVAANTTAAGRRLVEVSGDNSMTGMERYALAIGIAPNKLLYVTIVGLVLLVAAIGVLLALVLAGGKLFSKDFAAFQVKMVDHAIGALVTLLIVSQYAIGVTAVFEINRVHRDQEPIGVSIFVAVLSLIVFAVGIMVYGYYVVRQHEDDIVDNGMKDHFEKKVHRRYGCLYDEYNYENRFFFVVKMILALLCGMTTGMATWTGLTQVCVLMALNIGFVLLLEVRQPHLAKFVQQTTTLITIMKIASLSLTIFLLTALVGLPNSARNVVSIVILCLQGLVVLFLLVRQVFIFYRQWKLKQSPEEPDTRAGSITMYYGQTQPTPPEAYENKLIGASRQPQPLRPLGGPRQPSFEAGKEYYL
ncbi:hypothetical protein ACHHYP_03499 [Achlya hypogyna]|uniref:TRP C-terminal domain-containing protein n=1 Tax=Achlya hypogyna TaxID=1202772 RepID=A0A1V9Z3I0_ACHHY|nr:hypothetical protein ACHHYP_03499 [Achlya hypogyna]